MVVKIRLARFGRTRQPVYNIVVSQARCARGSKPMEVLGTYDPLPRIPLATNDGPDAVQNDVAATNETKAGSAARQSKPIRAKRYKDIVLDTTRTKYWLGVGAQPSEPVEKLFSMMGLIEPKPHKAKQRGLTPSSTTTANSSFSSSSSSQTAAQQVAPTSLSSSRSPTKKQTLNTAS